MSFSRQGLRSTERTGPYKHPPRTRGKQRPTNTNGGSLDLSVGSFSLSAGGKQQQQPLNAKNTNTHVAPNKPRRGSSRGAAATGGRSRGKTGATGQARRKSSVSRAPKKSASGVDALRDETKKMEDRLNQLRLNIAKNRIHWDAVNSKKENTGSGSIWQSAKPDANYTNNIIANAKRSARRTRSRQGRRPDSKSSSRQNELLQATMGQQAAPPATATRTSSSSASTSTSTSTNPPSASRSALTSTSTNTDNAALTSVSRDVDGRTNNYVAPSASLLDQVYNERDRNTNIFRGISDVLAANAAIQGKAHTGYGAHRQPQQQQQRQPQRVPISYAEGYNKLGSSTSSSSSMGTSTNTTNTDTAMSTGTGTSTSPPPGRPKEGEAGSLLFGAYDAAAASRSFQEARNQWLGVSQPQQASASAQAPAPSYSSSRFTVPKATVSSSQVRKVSYITPSRHASAHTSTASSSTSTSTSTITHTTQQQSAAAASTPAGQEGQAGWLLSGSYDESRNRSAFAEARDAWLNGTADTSAANTASAEADGSLKESWAARPGSLLEGPAYDEKAAHADFEEARLAFLSSQKSQSQSQSQSQPHSQSSKRVVTASAVMARSQRKAQNATAIAATTGTAAGDWNVSVAQNGISSALTETFRTHDKSRKASCYQCYRLYYVDHSVTEPESKNQFCSDACVNRFYQEQRITCGDVSCFKTVLRKQSVTMDGVVLCRHCAILKKDQLAQSIAQEAEKEKEKQRQAEENAKAEEMELTKIAAAAYSSQSTTACAASDTHQEQQHEAAAVAAPSVEFPDDDDDDDSDNEGFTAAPAPVPMAAPVPVSMPAQPQAPAQPVIEFPDDDDDDSDEEE